MGHVWKASMDLRIGMSLWNFENQWNRDNWMRLMTAGRKIPIRVWNLKSRHLVLAVGRSRCPWKVIQILAKCDKDRLRPTDLLLRATGDWFLQIGKDHRAAAHGDDISRSDERSFSLFVNTMCERYRPQVLLRQALRTYKRAPLAMLRTTGQRQSLFKVA